MTAITPGQRAFVELAFADNQVIDNETFRRSLSLWPSGVSVITTAGSEGLAGMTVSSFTSISLDPPLVGFYAGLSSSTWAMIKESRIYAVNVLSEEQEELCGRFAGRDRNFDGLVWQGARTGSPIIDGVVCALDCELVAEIVIGDHVLAVGAVVHTHISQEPPQPLLWHNRGTATLALRKP
jgi:3-hydroxy-9,10-secoandrosta-1,3,5(10)-triene-9,17-dione monooxygenase reductase component